MGNKTGGGRPPKRVRKASRHDGTIIGASYVSGTFGDALSFNGNNSYVFISDAQGGGTTGAGLDAGTRDWTVSGMVVTKVGFVGGANPDGWALSVSGNGTVGAVLHKSGGGTVNIFAGDGATVNDGQWHHIAVVFAARISFATWMGASTGTQYSLASLSGQSVDNTKQLRIGARDQEARHVCVQRTLRSDRSCAG